MSLNSVDITWNVPADNNAPITGYLLSVCGRGSLNDTQCSIVNETITLQIAQLVLNQGANQLTFTYIESLPGNTYEVFVRAENSIGPTDSPELGDGHVFNAASANDGQVANAGFIPTPSGSVIVSWILPLLAKATADLVNVTFNVTYFNDGFIERNVTEIVDYNEGVLEQGITLSFLEADRATHTVEIIAHYGRPQLVAAFVRLTRVTTLPIGENSYI